MVNIFQSNSSDKIIIPFGYITIKKFSRVDVGINPYKVAVQWTISTSHRMIPKY